MPAFVAGSLVAAVIGFNARPATATAAIIPIVGGDTMAATTAANGGTGQYTSLSGPTITEAAAGDISPGTVVIDAPPGFQFGPLPVTVADISGSTSPGGIALAPASADCASPSSSISVTPTASQLSFAVCSASTDLSHLASLQFAGLEARPSSTTVGVTGQVTLDSSSSAITGATDLGTLHEVPGPPAAFVVGSTAPTVTTGSPTTITLVTTDAVGNPTSGYTGTVSFRSTDPRATMPAPFTFSGQTTALAPSPAIFRTAGNQTVSATDATAPSISGSVAVSVTPGPPAALEVSGIPSPTSAGVAATATITVVDAFGNTTPAYTGSVQLQSSDAQAQLPPPHTFTPSDGGTVQERVTLTTAGIQSVSAADAATSITGAQSGIEVVAGPIQGLRVDTFPTVQAGLPDPVSVVARDAFGNTVTDFTGTVTLTSSDPAATFPPPYRYTAADAGSHVFSPGVLFASTGPQTVTAADGGQSGAKGTSPPVDVSPGPAAAMTVTPSSMSTQAGAPLSVTVAVFDKFGNVATDYTGHVTLASTDPGAVLPAGYAFTVGPGGDNGVHTFTMTLTTAGRRVVSVVEAAPVGDTQPASGTSPVLTVTPGPLTRLALGVSPSTPMAGSRVDVKVTALDDYGNVATGFTGTVTLSSSDPTSTIPAPSAAVDGMTTVDGLVFATAGPQSVTASFGFIASTATGIVVRPGPAASFELVTPPTAQAGTAFAVTATAVDAYGNVASGYVGTAQVLSSDPKAVLPSAVVFGALDLGLRDVGVSLVTAGSETVTVTDPLRGITGSSEPIDVAAARATSLTLTGTPAATTAGGLMSITVTALDPFGNPASGFADPVRFKSSDPQAGLPAQYLFVPGAAGDHGIHRFAIALRTSGSQTITALDDSKPDLTETSRSIDVVAGPAAALHLSSTPAFVAADNPTSVVVSVSDAYGNAVPSYSGSIHFTSSDALATVPPDYAFTGDGLGMDSGAHLFTDALVLRTGGIQTIRAADRSDAAISGVERVGVMLSGSLRVTPTAAGVSLAPVTLNGVTQYATGSMGPVQIEDGRTGALGWSVTATLSDLSIDGRTDPEHTIPASEVTWNPGANGGCHPLAPTGLGAPAGLAVGVMAGPGGLTNAASRGVGLDPTNPASMCLAAPGRGLGMFVVQPTIQVQVDASKAAGVYVGILTITAS